MYLVNGCTHFNGGSTRAPSSLTASQSRVPSSSWHLKSSHESCNRGFLLHRRPYRGPSPNRALSDPNRRGQMLPVEIHHPSYPPNWRVGWTSTRATLHHERPGSSTLTPSSKSSPASRLRIWRECSSGKTAPIVCFVSLNMAVTAVVLSRREWGRTSVHGWIMRLAKVQAGCHRVDWFSASVQTLYTLNRCLCSDVSCSDGGLLKVSAAPSGDDTLTPNISKDDINKQCALGTNTVCQKN